MKTQSFIGKGAPIGYYHNSLYHSFFEFWRNQNIIHKTGLFLGMILLFISTCLGIAAVRYVDVNSPNPTPPYTNWGTAAQTIQDAVDAAQSGDTVLVTNGIYKSGGKSVYGSVYGLLTNRVAIDKPITVKSVNGPESTFIVGAEASAGGNGDGAIRCAYVGTNALLSGFTLTNGHTLAFWSYDDYKEFYGGGVWCETIGIVSNCVMVGNSAYYDGGGSHSGIFYNSILTGNSAGNDGGGADEGILYNCILTGNTAESDGGGANECTLYNCTLTNNYAGDDGGGADEGTLYNCTVSGNFAVKNGGGTHRSIFYNCILSSNSAGKSGGGADKGDLYNSTLTGNSAIYDGGGADECALYNCTIIGNSAKEFGGGVANSTNYNCIVYYNTSPNYPNYYYSTFKYSCTAPLPDGEGNISADPLLASFTHISANSPCLKKGSPQYSSGVDIDGEQWLDPPDMGADEYIFGNAKGEIVLSIDANYKNVATGFAISFIAQNRGPISATVWDFGDGVVVSNKAYINHIWNTPGEYTVRLTGYNDSYPSGVSVTTQITIVNRTVYYVNAECSSPMPPYSSWQTAARTIQDAVDIAMPGGIVLVTNGIYNVGGKVTYGLITNRVAIDKPVIVQSVNGPTKTFIVGAEASAGGNGDDAVRCAYVGTNSLLSGFTLTNGHTSAIWNYDENGGGALCELSGVVSNCVLIGNSAINDGGGVWGGIIYNCTLTGNSANDDGGAAAGCILYNCIATNNYANDQGGGADEGTLYNCTLTRNYARNRGGGVNECTLYNCILTVNSVFYEGGGSYYSTLYNCTLTGNSSENSGGGVISSTLYNCILYYNTAFVGANYLDSIINYSCTTPLPYGEGNISDDPLLITSTHISANSPCLGKGSSKYAIGVDIDGEQWLDPPAMGADQYILGNAKGGIIVSIDVNYTNIATGFAASFVAQNQGAISATVWDFGDGTTVSNRAFVNHSWTTPGDYIVRLTGYNDSFPSGISATVLIKVSQSVFYVNAKNSSPSFPYSRWETAAQTIQDAIDAGTLPGRLILVTNGIYDTGGSADYGRVILTNAATVKSVNGPTETFIVGSSVSGGAIRCVYMVKDAVLSGFTLTNGNAQFGGGVFLETGGVVSNCVLVGNSAGFGGGAYFGTFYTYFFSDYYGLQWDTYFYSTLYNCALINNSAYSNGGGAENVTLYDCILAGNTSGDSGGAVYNSTLYNCTLTNNLANMNGGGVYWCTLHNCELTSNFAGNCGGGAFNSIVYNCALINNSAKTNGGGAYLGILHDCILAKNSAYGGGGGYNSTNYNCTFTENSADLGGGAYGCSLNNCSLNYNSAKSYGGGAYSSALYNCNLNRNSANAGGGSYNSTNYNSALTCNSAFNGGGGHSGEFYNCTLTGNSARYDGGGVYSSKLYNCIVYYNKSPGSPNYLNSTFNYSCTTPLPNGEGNITNEPLFISATHISANSPCIGKGSSQYASRVDIDGEQWLNPPSMGADEYISGNVNGTLIVSIDVSRTNVPTGYSVSFVAQNQGQISAIVWDFGNGVIISNQSCINYSWNTPGDYTVRLTGYNGSFPSGVSATAVIKVVSKPAHYVNAKSASPLFPYSNWETAAQTIQEAVDAAQSGDVVLVTNGIYNTGGLAVYGQMTNRVVLNKEVIVKSVNGPTETFIVGSAGTGDGNGNGAIRCVYVGTNAILSGFTLTNGHTRTSGDFNKEQSGGGVWCDVGGIVSNCVLIGNSAQNNGGGAYGATLYNCIVISNSVRGNGGGTYYSTLYNCTLTANSAKGNGGGVSRSTLYNSIVYYNLSTRNTNYSESIFRYSCAMPLPDGVGNISDEPMFASATHLSASSLCLGKGNSIYARGVDIDGEPWLEPPAMGADQYVPNNAKGPLTVSINVRDTNAPTGFKVSFVAQSQGLISSSVWDFGDGITVSNQAYVSHSWSSPGIYTVRLIGYNDSLPSGVSATVQIKVVNQPVFYVDCESKSPIYPYSSWETAATNIQDAIDADTSPGRLVIVNDGIYDIGGRVVYGQMTNRVILTNGVILKSMNGPNETLIVGSSATRCVYVGSNSVLIGFTLKNGQTLPRLYYGDYGSEDKSGGAVWCEPSGSVSNCVLVGNSAFSGGSAYGGTFYDCTFIGNSAVYGGAVCNGTLYNCALTGNYATYGGCADKSDFYNCSLTDNSAESNGGGSSDSILYNCKLKGNSANYGGGASGGALYNCILTGNLANVYGGGSYNSTLYNCALTDNSATTGGGGDYASVLYNCTLTLNYAKYGGGVSHSSNYNCIVYYNTANDYSNYYSSTFNYSCTTPLSDGIGNMTNEPMFVDLSLGNLRLQANSPCINAGTNYYAYGDFDLDGRPRIVALRVDMGAYEFQTSVTGEFIAWLQRYGLPTDGSADYADSDGDGLNNWREFQLGINPLVSNIGGYFGGIQNLPNNKIRLNLVGKPGQHYQLETSSNLINWFEFISVSITNADGSISIDETNSAPLRFYRSRLMSE